MIQTHKYICTGRAITEQDFNIAIGKVLNNSRDWGGERERQNEVSQKARRSEKQKNLVSDSQNTYESDETADLIKIIIKIFNFSPNVFWLLY